MYQPWFLASAMWLLAKGCQPGCGACCSRQRTVRIGAVIWASFPCSRWSAIKTFLVLRMSVCVLWWTYTITKERCWYYTWEIWGHLRVLYFLGDRHKQDERYSEVSLVVSKYMWQQVCECWKEERVFLEVGRILKDTRSGWFYVDLGKASYFCFF